MQHAIYSDYAASQRKMSPRQLTFIVVTVLLHVLVFVGLHFGLARGWNKKKENVVEAVLLVGQRGEEDRGVAGHILQRAERTAQLREEHLARVVLLTHGQEALLPRAPHFDGDPALLSSRRLSDQFAAVSPVFQATHARARRAKRRKSVIVVSDIFFIAGAALMGGANTSSQLIVGRSVVGVAIGVACAGSHTGLTMTTRI